MWKEISANKKFAYSVLLFLVVVRLVIVILTINNIPPTAEMASGQWFINGGDGDGYFESAKALLDGRFLPNAVPAGLALIYSPIIWFTGADILPDIIVVMAILYGVIFSGLAVMLVYFLARKFFNGIRSILIAAAFLIYPYLFYAFFMLFGNGSGLITRFAASRFLQLNFFYIASDAWSLLLTISSIFVLFKAVAEPRAGTKRGLLLGVLTGWAVITRLQNVILLPVYACLLLWRRRFRSFVYLIIGCLPFGIFQAYVNYRSNGSIFKTAYNEKWEQALSVSAVSVKYPLKIIEYALNFSPLLFVPLFCGLGLIVLGIWRLARLERERTIILALYFFSILIFISFLAGTFLNPRYFLPVVPAALIFVYAGAEQIYLLTTRALKTIKR
jgi:hypothetical protein